MGKYRLGMLASAAIVVALQLPANQAQAQSAAPVQADAQTDRAEARADALLAQMTLEEKVGQVGQQFVFGPNPAIDVQVREGKLGSLLFVTEPAIINRFQRIAVTESRLKIPLLFGFDVIHGFRTIFPVPLANAASFDPATAERGQAIAAAEARAVGIHWAFAPMVDIARDPRWGRIVEGAGEDPYLGAAMGRAQVRGFQGARIGAPGHIIAGPKHFMGYGASVGGRDYDSAWISDAELYNVYLPPFAAAIKAGAGNVMSAYMDLNDIPASGNRWLLTDVLRGQLGFKGWVVSDANGVNNQATQHFARDQADAAIRAITAGNDMEMSFGPGATTTLVQAVRQGKLPEATLNQAVRRILVAKFRMGLFENPYVDEGQAAVILATPAHRDAAQVAAERSLVLLKNDGAVLPLAAGAYRKVAVIGPLADSRIDTLGSWVFKHDLAETVTLFAGVRDRVGKTATVDTAPGVQIKRNTVSPFDAMSGVKVTPWDAAQADAEFKRAVDLASASDVIILALGEKATMSGEGASRSDLQLPGDQRKLFDAAVATGKPVVVVLMNGRPLDLTGIADKAPAILEAWYPGTRGGTAVARALFGDVNPGGKTPITWPRSVGQIPMYYAHNTTHAPAEAAKRYWDTPSTPLYEFGFGLSYTSFAIGEPTVTGELAPGGKVTVAATVTNSGQRAGDEVVQLYIHQRSGRASRPVRELKGFERITLKPGESRTVSFELDEQSVRYWNAAERGWVIDPGTFDVWVGNSSNAKAHGTFVVGGNPRAAVGFK
ncbi:MAG: beta-glucosidase BglX [Novosphingobium sp.]